MIFSFIMSISIASILVSDRTEGTYRRIKSARVTSFQYVLSIAALGGILMLFMAGPTIAIYALSGSDPGVPLFATIGILAAFAAFVVAFGLLVGVLMPAFGGIVALITAVGAVAPMLGGAWFPIETAPAAFQAAGKVTPHYWVFEAVRAWQAGEGNVYAPILIILLAAVLLFVLAGIRFTSNKGLAR
jgi:ABC-type multidrug transport system permease subunit